MGAVLSRCEAAAPAANPFLPAAAAAADKVGLATGIPLGWPAWAPVTCTAALIGQQCRQLAHSPGQAPAVTRVALCIAGPRDEHRLHGAAAARAV